MCKVLTKGDYLTALLLQIDQAPYSSYNKATTLLKQFLAWKENGNNPSRPNPRSIDLCNPNYIIMANYTKDQMAKYQQTAWFQYIDNRLQHKTTTGTLGSEGLLREIMTEARNKNITLKPKNMLFTHGTTKYVDSRLLDFIHGSSPLFGSMRVKLDNSNQGCRSCFFCNVDADSPGHQIFECLEVRDETYHRLRKCGQNMESTNLMAKCIVPSSADTTMDIQRAFIDRVAFLADQQESMHDGYARVEGDT